MLLGDRDRDRGTRAHPARRSDRDHAIGFLVAMLFVVYRSPDILLTQILIETVSTIFVLLVLVFLPAFPRERPVRVARGS